MESTAAPLKSVSEITRNRGIFLVNVLDAQIPPWQPSGGGLASRKVAMRLVIEEVLKGEVKPPAGTPFSMEITQRGTGSMRVMDYYGLWSHVNIKPGAEWVAFSTGSSAEAIQLLEEPACEQLVPPEQALDDVRAAMALERQKAAPAAIVEAAQQKAAERGAVFARFVWDRSGQAALQSKELFKGILSIITSPSTSLAGRQEFITRVDTALSLLPSPRRDLEREFLLDLFQLLGSPAGETLREDLATRVIPNLIGLPGKAEHKAADVFGASAELRGRVRTELQHPELDPKPTALLQWLNK